MVVEITPDMHMSAMLGSSAKVRKSKQIKCCAEF
jgi:hypothetical protein